MASALHIAQQPGAVESRPLRVAVVRVWQVQSQTDLGVFQAEMRISYGCTR